MMVCPRNPRGCRRCWVKWLLSFDLSHPHNWRLKIWDIHNNAQYEYFNQCEIFSNLFLRNKRVILWNLNLLLVKTENFISFNIYPLKVFESLPVFNQYISGMSSIIPWVIQIYIKIKIDLFKIFCRCCTQVMIMVGRLGHFPFGTFWY